MGEGETVVMENVPAAEGVEGVEGVAEQPARAKARLR
jgi:hypothetical protein